MWIILITHRTFFSLILVIPKLHLYHKTVLSWIVCDKCVTHSSLITAVKISMFSKRKLSVKMMWEFFISQVHLASYIIQISSILNKATTVPMLKLIELCQRRLMCFLKSFLLDLSRNNSRPPPPPRKYTMNFVSHWDNKIYSSDINIITYFAGIQLLYKGKDMTIGF